MANSKRRCRECRKYLPAESGVIINGGFYCSMDHALYYANANKGKQIARAKNQKHKEKKEKVKTLSKWKSDAQFWFNKFIRLRDSGRPCCSCDKPDNGKHQRHASHYRSVGACSSLRYHEENVWASCSVCNNHLSGNLAEYRIRLIRLLGVEKVEWLESQPKAYKWTVDELKEIISKYKAKCRELESEL